MSARVTLAVVALCIGVGLGLAAGRWSFSASPQASSSKLHEYCGAVSAGLEMDARDLEHGSDQQKLAAAARFGEQVTFHSEHEILLCARKPVDLQRRAMCAIGPNYDCLAKIAREASAAVSR